MADLTIRIGGYQPERSVHTRALHRLAATIRERLGDRVAVEVVGSVTALGRRADDLLTMTEGHELDICYFSSSYLAARVPSLGLFDQAFRFADRAAAYEALDGPLAQRMAGDVAECTGFRVLGFWDNGIRHISNRRHPIRHPSDCQGLRIRTLDNAAHQAFFRKLGFEPVFVDVKDLPGAVADGTVDAQENPLTNLVNFGLHRHHRFVSLTAHLFGVALVLANRQRLDSWPAEVREVVRTAMITATAAQRRDAETEDRLCLDSLQTAGVAFTPPTDIDRPAFLRLAGQAL
jgi:C4-dicarboxylate-binding protein DctP